MANPDRAKAAEDDRPGEAAATGNPNRGRAEDNRRARQVAIDALVDGPARRPPRQAAIVDTIISYECTTCSLKGSYRLSFINTHKQACYNRKVQIEVGANAVQIQAQPFDGI